MFSKKLVAFFITTATFGLLSLPNGCSDKLKETDPVIKTEKNAEKISFQDLLKKAETGDAQSQVEVGTRYAIGDGIESSADNAINWWKKAADQENTDALHYLGYAFTYGVTGLPWEKTVKIDTKKGFDFYKRGAELGDPRSQYELGKFFEQGVAVKKNLQAAFDWYSKAASQGDHDAESALGEIYYFGSGVQKDFNKALEFFIKAAEGGILSAQIHAGIMYDLGDGTPKDYNKAAHYYRKAAMMGNATAQNSIGSKYAEGKGITKDNVLAYAWFNLASAKGDKLATDNRAIVEKRLSIEELNEAQALSSGWSHGQDITRGNNSPSQKLVNLKLSKLRTGTAFFVSKTGHALTNYHVIDGCEEIRLQGSDKPLKLMSSDKANDIALVTTNSDTTKYAPLVSNPSKIRQGDEIAVFGFPLNSLLSSGGNLTPGVISATTGIGNNTNQIQITAPIQPGSSGSPVLNLRGEVIGIVAMKLSDTKMAKATGSVGQNVNFAVNAQTIKGFLESNNVTYTTATLNLLPKSIADLGDDARKWTTLLECWK